MAMAGAGPGAAIPAAVPYLVWDVAPANAGAPTFADLMPQQRIRFNRGGNPLLRQILPSLDWQPSVHDPAFFTLPANEVVSIYVSSALPGNDQTRAMLVYLRYIDIEEMSAGFELDEAEWTAAGNPIAPLTDIKEFALVKITSMPPDLTAAAHPRVFANHLSLAMAPGLTAAQRSGNGTEVEWSYHLTQEMLFDVADGDYGLNYSQLAYILDSWGTTASRIDPNSRWVQVMQSIYFWAVIKRDNTFEEVDTVTANNPNLLAAEIGSWFIRTRLDSDLMRFPRNLREWNMELKLRNALTYGKKEDKLTALAQEMDRLTRNRPPLVTVFCQQHARAQPSDFGVYTGLIEEFVPHMKAFDVNAAQELANQIVNYVVEYVGSGLSAGEIGVKLIDKKKASEAIPGSLSAAYPTGDPGAKESGRLINKKRTPAYMKEAMAAANTPQFTAAATVT